jgi:hypothetical protein
VDLSKKAMLTGNYKELDDAIRMKIPKYLYNGGKVKRNLVCFSMRRFVKVFKYKGLHFISRSVFSCLFGRKVKICILSKFREKTLNGQSMIS